MTPTIFGSTVGYPSDSLASCIISVTELRQLVVTVQRVDRLVAVLAELFDLIVELVDRLLVTLA